MERLEVKLEMLRQNESDKQCEHELKKLEVELHAQTEKEMEVKRTTNEMEQRCLELVRQFGTSSTCYSCTSKLLKLNILKWQEFWVPIEASVHRNPNLQPVDKFNYLKPELEGDASAVIFGLELSNSNCEVAQGKIWNRRRYDDPHLLSIYVSFCVNIFVLLKP